MITNLFTATVKNNVLSVFDGWFSVVSENQVFAADLPHSIPAHHCNLKNETSPYYLLSGSLKFEDELQDVEKSREDDPFSQDRKDFVPVLRLYPLPDESDYYLLILDDEQKVETSPALKVYKNERIRSDFDKNKVERRIYFSVPRGTPLTLDNQGKLCVNPF